jgi:hypothetical protein
MVLHAEMVTINVHLPAVNFWLVPITIGVFGKFNRKMNWLDLLPQCISINCCHDSDDYRKSSESIQSYERYITLRD